MKNKTKFLIVLGLISTSCSGELAETTESNRSTSNRKDTDEQPDPNIEKNDAKTTDAPPMNKIGTSETDGASESGNQDIEDPVSTKQKPEDPKVITPGVGGLNDTGVVSFFVTSNGSGTSGGNLGGLPGADARCQLLAANLGRSEVTWHAYLSLDSNAAGGAINARDRIGSGPWYDAKGELVAQTVAELHANGIARQRMWTDLIEDLGTYGVVGHDIFTGSNREGMSLEGDTCGNWRSDAEAMVGRIGHSDIDRHWNYNHSTRGCSESAMKRTNAIGRIYCFAVP